MAEKRLPYYAGNEFARMDLSDGGLLHAVGASNYQVLRANRAHPETADGRGYTYNHAPMLTQWRNRFYLEYLGNPVSEHTGAGVTMLTQSDDGIHWSMPQLAFPPLEVPAGVHACADGETVVIPEARPAVMHQRMGFYHSPDDRLLVLGFYGHTPTPYRCPWGNYGIGRVVREVYSDGRLGDIYFIRILEASGWTAEQLPWPLYTHCPDAGFVRACEALLADALVTQQWAEEHGVRDAYVRMKDVEESSGKPYQAFSWYHIDATTVVAMWKHAFVGLSRDGGRSWTIKKENSFVTSGGKMWGQRTADGRFAAVYLNSLGSEHRYPMVVVTADDGIRFDHMAVVCGETPPRRYEGLFKDFGPQYLRGICEGHQSYPTDAMYIAHSMNKEDIWITRIPLPIRRAETQNVDDTFSMQDPYLTGWNVYSPRWAPVRACCLADGSQCMRIADAEPADYARVMRVFRAGCRVEARIFWMSAASYTAPLFIELADAEGTIACRVQAAAAITATTTSVTVPLSDSVSECGWHELCVTADAEANRYWVMLDGKNLTEDGLTVIAKVNAFSRLILRTKPVRRAPGMAVRPDAPDLPNSDEKTDERVFYIRRVIIRGENGPAALGSC